MCHALGAKVLLVCSSTSAHATGDTRRARARPAQARDARRAARHPHRLRGAVVGPARQRVPAGLGDRASARTARNLGLALDSFHVLATRHRRSTRSSTSIPDKIFLVQLADFMWQEIRSPEERINTARHFRVFPGEGVHSAEVAALVRRLDEMGYRGDYSFEVFNDDYAQLPLADGRRRARAPSVRLAGERRFRGAACCRGPGGRRRLSCRRSDRLAGGCSASTSPWSVGPPR